MPARHRNVCLVTVTSERFLAGTLVTLGSFFKHHPCFVGDVVVLHDALLPEAHRAVLATAFAGLRFEPVSAALCERLTRLATAQPRVKDRLPRFYTLDAFRLDGYRKVLFCDSDLLFRASVDDLFGVPDALLCCGCAAFLRGRHRDAATFAPVAPAVPAGATRTLDRTFNCGFLPIDAALVAAGSHAALLAMLSPATWPNTPHTDAVPLNRVFAGRQTLISSTYNYLLPAADAIRAREGLAPADAKVLHFNYPDKPWQPDAMLAWMSGTVSFKSAPAFKLWYDAWVDCLAGAHTRNALGRQDECA